MKSDADISRFADGVTWVWLDLDDTLIDFRTNSRAALRLLYEAEGLDRFWSIPETWIAAYEAHNHLLWDRYSRAEITQDFLRVNRFAGPIAHAWTGNVAELEAFARHLDPIYLDLLARQKNLVDGAMELLDTLHERGYRTGILSNGFTDVQHRKLAVTEIGPKIDMVVLSDDIGVNKPDTRLYHHAMQRAGEPDPQRHLMIGDNPSTDIAGALAAGWRAILLDPAEPGAIRPGDTSRELVTPSLRGLAEVFRGAIEA